MEIKCREGIPPYSSKTNGKGWYTVLVINRSFLEQFFSSRNFLLPYICLRDKMYLFIHFLNLMRSIARSMHVFYLRIYYTTDSITICAEKNLRKFTGIFL